MQAVFSLDDDVVTYGLRVLKHANLIQAVRYDDEHGQQTRYGTLETVREFALMELARLELLEPARHRHAEFFAQLAAAAKPQLTSPQMGYWLDRLERDLDNIRAAVAWCSVHAAGTGLELVSNIEQFWFTRGNLREARAWLDDLLAQSVASSEHELSTTSLKQLADGNLSAGILSMRVHEHPIAKEQLHKSLQLYLQLNDEHNIALALSKLGVVASGQGDYSTAERYQRESLALSKRIGYVWNVAASLNNLAESLRTMGNFDEALRCFAESAACYREIGDLSSSALAICNRAIVFRQMGDHAEAQRLLDDSYAVFADLGDKTHMAHALWGMAKVARELGQINIAQRRYRECIALFVAGQFPGDTLMALRELAHLEWAAGAWSAERVAELLSMTAVRLEASRGVLNQKTKPTMTAC